MKSQSCNKFRERIERTAKDKGLPLRVMFELTYRCNFRCRHCYVPESYRCHNELKTKEVFSILDQLRDIGCFYLGFTGGEPFIREDIMDILRYAKKNGFEIIIYTNGSLITREIAGELRSLIPNKIDITIPAMSENTFERITGVPGSHKKVFNAVTFLDREGLSLGLKTSVLKENEREIKEIQKFAGSLGALYRLSDMLFPCLDGSNEPPQTLFRCGVGVSQAAITPLGELKMCLMIQYPRYKILKSSLKHAWECLKDEAKNIKADGSHHCGLLRWITE